MAGRRLWPRAQAREMFPDHDGSGDGLDLNVASAHDNVLYRAPAIDFHSAPGRAELDAVEYNPIPEGRVLDLEPQYDVALPSHPTMVKYMPEVNEPKSTRRQRRWPVVAESANDEGALADIERALAAEGSP